jgi:hypothetical protein
MFSNSTFSIKAFGNDTIDGSTYPFTTLIYLGHPFGVFCNEIKGGGTAPCSGANTIGQDGIPMTGEEFHIVESGVAPAFQIHEGRIAAVHGTPATSFSYGPAGTKRPKNGVPGGSFSYYFPYIYSYSYADLKNAAGSFFGGGGGPPSGWSVAWTEGGYPAGSVKVAAGDNQFGGTMRLLGFYFSNNAFQQPAGLSVAVSSTWKFEYIGAGAKSTLPGYATPSDDPGVQVFTTNYGFNTGVAAIYTGFVKGSAFPWTTGTVTVEARRAPPDVPFETFMKRTGYDNRTSGGLGNIQMVSPMLTHWTCPACGTDIETGAIGILNMEFVPVPEPANAMMLVAGISMLGLIYRANHRA